MKTLDADLEQLRLLDARPDTPISLFRIGVPLIGERDSQAEILNTLFVLESKKKIELVPGNRVRMVMSL